MALSVMHSLSCPVDRRRLLASSCALMLAGGVADARTLSVPGLALRRGQTNTRDSSINWRSETGETVIRSLGRAPQATIFSVAYLAEPSDARTRPVAFIWNGGPGGASWELREQLSPRLTIAAPGRPGYAFANNVDSIIDVADLVFIDAPGTGFSRIYDASIKADLWGIEEDGRAFSTFIVNWLRDHKRLQSPILLLGESYGGTRAIQVMRNLSEQSIRITGLVLVSPALEEGLKPGPLSTIEDIAPEACVAWFHRRGSYLSLPVESIVQRAESFATQQYSSKLKNRAGLSAAARGTAAAALSGYIGLSIEEIEQRDLAPTAEEFRSLLLADQGLDVRAGDGRETIAKPKPGLTASVLTPDTSYDITASIEALIRNDLGYAATGHYSRDPTEIGDKWNYATKRPANCRRLLADALATNPTLQLYLIGGVYDTIVPFPGPARVLDFVPEGKITRHLYATGHAVFGDKELRTKAVGDLRNWVNRVTRSESTRKLGPDI